MTIPHMKARPAGAEDTCQGAQDPTPSKAGPMPSMPYRPPYMRQHHQTRLRQELTNPLGADPAEVWAEIIAIWDDVAGLHQDQDATDRGIVEAGEMANDAGRRADTVGERLNKVVEAMREAVRELRADRLGADPLPCYEISRDELEAATPIPPGSNESLSRELDSTDEEMLAGLATELWGHDEYLEIVAEDYRQRNGGAS